MSACTGLPFDHFAAVSSLREHRTRPTLYHKLPTLPRVLKAGNHSTAGIEAPNG